MSADLILRETSPLASVQKVQYVASIPRRDNLVAARVLGFHVIVRKDDFFKDDCKESLCVFFETDTLLDPQDPRFKFMDSKKGRLVERKKLYGIQSDGLCMTLESLGLSPLDVFVGQDLCTQLNVSKYVAPSEKHQYVPKQRTGSRPFPVDVVPKTDEQNVQTLFSSKLGIEFLDAIKNRRVTVTIKVDGSSATFTHCGKICGRNFEWTEQDNSNAMYFEMESKHNILAKLRGTSYCVQGEVCGPKINGNHLGLTENHFYVFNIFDTLKNCYIPHTDLKDLCVGWGFETVPCLFYDVDFKSLGMATVDVWVSYVNDLKNQSNQSPVEGVVIKTCDGAPRISFKVLSTVYK